jgi:hypothetical protein
MLHGNVADATVSRYYSMLLEARAFAAVSECGDASRGIKLARFPLAISVIWSRIEERGLKQSSLESGWFKTTIRGISHWHGGFLRKCEFVFNCFEI